MKNMQPELLKQFVRKKNNSGAEFFQLRLDNYLVDYYPAGRDICITFENREDDRVDALRFPWGYQVLTRSGHSILGVKTFKSDWYRGRSIIDFFSSDKYRDFLKNFSNVYYYGSSMGGFGALTFATPGSSVLVFNPQTTLCSRTAPWDRRWPEATQLDWSSPFGDAKEGSRKASAVYAVFDPFNRLDRRHIERLDEGNLVKLPLPFGGHGVSIHMRDIGILGASVSAFLSNDLSRELWVRLARARRTSSRHYFRLAQRSRNKKVAETCMQEAISCSTFGQRDLAGAFAAAKKHSLWTSFEQLLLTAVKGDLNEIRRWRDMVARVRSP